MKIRADTWRYWAAGLMLLAVTSVSNAIESSGREHTVVLGTTWQIAEDDLLSFIEQRILHMQANGEMDALQKQFQNNVRQKADRPDPVTGIRRTDKPHTHWYDPSVVVTSDLTDDRGHVFAKVGERFNPLKIHKPGTWLVFFDGDDERQVDWMDQFLKRRPDQVKPVLINGSVSKMSKHLHQPVYFDQAGTLAGKFEIRQVPAVVKVEQDRLRIDEVIP